MLRGSRRGCYRRLQRGFAAVGIDGVGGHDHEAEGGDGVGGIDVGVVGDHALERGEEGASEDRHDQAAGSDLRVAGVLASHDAAEGDAVDGGEHQAHEGADEDQRADADPARAGAQDDREAQQGGHHTAEGEEARGGEPAHQPGIDEAGEAVADDGDQVDAAGGGLQAACLLHHQADGEAPHANLRADVEELGDHATAVEAVGEEAAEAGPDAVAAVVVLARGHAGEEHHHEDAEQDEAEGGVGAADGVEADVVEDEVLAHQDAEDGADGIEALRNVEAARGRARVTHAHDVGVGRGLQDAAAAGHHVDGNEVEAVARDAGGGKEEHRAGGVEEQAEDDARLEAPATDEEGRGQGEAEVAAVERELDEGGLRIAHGHDALEGGKQRVGHVVGKAPEEEHARDQREGNGVASVDRFHHFTMPFSRYSARFMRTLAAAPSEATFAMS